MKNSTVALASALVIAGAIVFAWGQAGEVSANDHVNGQEKCRHGERKEGRRAMGEAIASYLGMTTDEFREEIKLGETLASVVTSNGGDLDELKAIMKEVITERIESSDMTDEQKQEKLDGLDERIEEMLTKTKAERGGKPRGPKPSEDQES